MGASVWPPQRRPGLGRGSPATESPVRRAERRAGRQMCNVSAGVAMSVGIRLRREGYQMIKELCDATGVKIADATRLWPKCPKCGSLLAEVGGVVTCVKCKTTYRLWTPQ